MRPKFSNIWFEAMLIILALRPQDDAVSRRKGQQVARAPPGHLCPSAGQTLH